MGQIYSPKRYEGRISKRPQTIGGKSLVEAVLPMASVDEYFAHFPVPEIDFTFYRPLLDHNGHPTRNYQVLRSYAGHLKEGDRILVIPG
jgi:hypothetical protein